MRNPKFTKGKWTLELGQQRTTAIWSGETQICDGLFCLHDRTQEEPHHIEAKANAHLIASAPAMYAAITEIAAMIRDSKNEIELADSIASIERDLVELLDNAEG